ncbi:MAG: PilT/PilU family type 4a pilus ATPase [Acidobacteriota bacterium]
MARIDAFLQLGREQGCSDIHLAPDQPPLLRLSGELKPISFRSIGEEELWGLLREILSAEQLEALNAAEDVDFTYEATEGGRFRVNLFRKLGGIGATFRVVGGKIPNFVELNLPETLRDLVDARQGLVLVTGAAGTGKSTTLAALIGFLNRTRSLNIITLEDPIEFVHQSERSIVVQREIGSHVPTFVEGLHAALREDPDVIMVGEMRDPETITLAMTAAETGHLVLGTLHTSSATKTLDRVLDVVPGPQKQQAAIFLAQHLRGVVSQRLVRTADGRGRKAIVEILVNTPAIANLILQRKIFLIPDQLRTGRDHGMQLMDQALLQAVKKEEIDPNDAFIFAEDKRSFQRYVTDPSILPQMSVGGR